MKLSIKINGMSQWSVLFGSLLFLFGCNSSEYPEITLTEAIAKIQANEIDKVEAISETTLLITERGTEKIFQASIDGQFDRIESIASNAHFEGTIGSYEFNPKPPSLLTTPGLLLLGGVLIGLLLLGRLFLLKRA